jgi:hypothetical protein
MIDGKAHLFGEFVQTARQQPFGIVGPKPAGAA